MQLESTLTSKGQTTDPKGPEGSSGHGEPVFISACWLPFAGPVRQ
jgi:hypothetical protein